MPVFKSIKRADLVAVLRKIGFTGPESGGKHQFMIKESLKITDSNVFCGIA